MKAEKVDSRVPGRRASHRGASRHEGPGAQDENLAPNLPGACAAAHKRAVMTVRLTLLLLIVGVALFLFTGSGGVPPSGAEPGAPAERHR